MSGKIIIIALGGNALNPVSQKEENSNRNQTASLENFGKQIAYLVKKKFRVIITHGNGPQVGNLFLQQELAKEYVAPLSLNTCVALSQAQIGISIQQILINALTRHHIKKPVIPVLTNIIVDPADPAFKNPTKPIGPAYTKQEAKKLEKTGMTLKQMPEGFYRRVVASPFPKKILEIEIIKNLIEKNVIVITGGGGGIPVTLKNKEINPIDAVIDKDLASALLAKEIGAEELIILTNINYVCLNYRKSNEQKLKNLKLNSSIQYLKEGQFPAGSMGPKIEAVIYFLKNGGRKAIIGHLSNIQKIIAGKSGTIIEK